MPTFFVVTNTERIDGAGVIFYPEFMDNMGNFWEMISSFCHHPSMKCWSCQDDGQVDAEMLRDMVKEVNATQVAPAERLTNDVYHFDTKDHVFEKGRQVHRTSERKRSTGCKNRESWKRTAGSETENKEARYGTLIKNNHLIN